MVRMTQRKTTVPSRRSVLALVVGLTALLAALVAGLQSAGAHAAYAESEPAFAAVLETSPDRIELRFTQELFRREGANSIALTHAESGATIRLGEVEIANQDRHIMAVLVLEPLAAGRYEVNWTNLSAEDGDADSGSYPFYVGRQPMSEEAQLDREIAAELLIAYPGDEPPEAEQPTSVARAAPAVVRGAAGPDTDGGGVGVGVWLWFALGLVAVALLVAVLWQARRGQPLARGG